MSDHSAQITRLLCYSGLTSRREQRPQERLLGLSVVSRSRGAPGSLQSRSEKRYTPRKHTAPAPEMALPLLLPWGIYSAGEHNQAQISGKERSERVASGMAPQVLQITSKVAFDKCMLLKTELSVTPPEAEEEEKAMG